MLMTVIKCWMKEELVKLNDVDEEVSHFFSDKNKANIFKRWTILTCIKNWAYWGSCLCNELLSYLEDVSLNL